MDQDAEMTIRLYDYWRSSACYRVRIALNLKSVAYEAVPTDLVAGAQWAAEYKALNPQGLVPLLEIDGLKLTQSLAIIDYLDAKYKQPPMVSGNPAIRTRQLAMALLIAADIHPVNNLRILKYLEGTLGVAAEARDDWYRHWIVEGFTALEAMVDPDAPFLCGDGPGIADCCLVPQMANARRFNTPLEAFPRLVEIDARCNTLDAFKAAHPDAVKTK
jgi:maleylacetoacetate isomerase